MSSLITSLLLPLPLPLPPLPNCHYHSIQATQQQQPPNCSSPTPFTNYSFPFFQTRTSVRFSTYSMSPSVAPTTGTSDSATAEIRDIEKGLDRMENKALTDQRVVLSEEKSEKLSKLALGAKLERALDRRMTSQDAVMRKKKPSVSGVEPNEKQLNEKQDS
ncbi:hypothetical protein V8F06_006329 [Rhypophila decipiens]